MSAAADVVTGYLASFAAGDPDVIAGFVADGFHNEHLSSIASSCVGRDEYRSRLPGFLSDFADRRYAVIDVVEQQRESRSDVVVRYAFTAVYDGTPIDIPGVMWFTVEDERITHRLDVWDSGTFLAQVAVTD